MANPGNLDIDVMIRPRLVFSFVLGALLFVAGGFAGAGIMSVFGCEQRAVVAAAVDEAVKPAEAPRPPAGAIDPADPNRRTAHIGKHVIEYDKDSTLEFETTDDAIDRGSASSREESIKSESIGAKMSGKDMKQEFKTDAASAGLSGGSGKNFKPATGVGGGGAYQGEIWGGQSVNIFYVFGALFIAGAGLYYVAKTMGTSMIPMPGTLRTSLTIGGVGAVFIAVGATIEMFPMVWMVAGLALMALVGVWAYNAFSTGKTVTKMRSATEHFVITTSRSPLSNLQLADNTTTPPTVKSLKDWIKSALAATGGGRIKAFEAAVAETKDRVGI